MFFTCLEDEHSQGYRFRTEPRHGQRQRINGNNHDNHETRETNVTPVVTPESRPKRDRKLTEKGLEYKLEIAIKERNEAHSKFTKQVKRIYSFLQEGIDYRSLENERETLDSVKEYFNEAHQVLSYVSPEEETQTLYQYFDLRDREYLECRTRVSDRLREIERARSEKTKSVKSFKSRSSSALSRSFRKSALAMQLEAETKAAKLEVELKFLQQDTEVRKLQLLKEAALARAEASTASKFVSKESEIESSESREQQETEVTNPDVCDIKEREDTPSRNTHTKKEDIANKGDTPTHTTPKREDSNLHAIKTEDTKDEKEPASSPHREIVPLHPDAASFRSYSDVVYPQGAQPLGPPIEPGGSTLRDLIRLQQIQTELSAMIVNQQRMSALPVQEPPMFSGNLLDYPIFIHAFETIIESKVDADKDRLYFLNKFTTSKANEVVKGFVTLNTPNGYEQAKKLLARRFGNPHHVAEAYKSKLRKWPKIKDEDGSMIQEFSDFLVRCRKQWRRSDTWMS